MKNNLKKEICLKWNKDENLNKCKYTKEQCWFAHGENDKNDGKNNPCINELKCWNEKCKFSHPDGWNPYENKKECVICKDGNCNKSNYKYKHIDNEKITNHENSEFNVDSENFPPLLNKNDELSWSDDMNIIEDNEKNINIEITVNGDKLDNNNIEILFKKSIIENYKSNIKELLDFLDNNENTLIDMPSCILNKENKYIISSIELLQSLKI